MDRVDLQILEDELERDAALFRKATELAVLRLDEPSEGRLAAAGYELNRAYNIIDRLFERICEAFENHFDKRGNYHEKLIERMLLNITGIRPAFLPKSSLRSIRELKGFRHLFRHAYELELDALRIETVLGHARRIAEDLPRWNQEFVASIRELHGV